MARPKKPLEAQSGDLTTKYRHEREIAEKGVAEKNREQFDEIPDDLTNEDAVKVWETWMAYLKDKNFYGNVNIPELIGYCNAWAANVAAWRKMKYADPDEELAILRKVKESSEEMTRCMNRGGFSVNARITLGEAMAREQAAEIEGQFGDI